MMRTRRRHGCAATAAAVLWLLAACAAPVPPPPTAPFPADSAQRTFEAAYYQISERYIEALPISTAALAGMSGLDTIDAGLGIELHGDAVVLTSASKPVRALPAPAEGDVAAWARLTVAIAQAARETSEAMRDAPPETVYQAVLDGALSHLDRFSRYTGADKAAENRAQRRGFGGVGIQFRWTDAGAVVSNVIPGSPAGDAGILEGDIVTEIGGAAASKFSLAEFRNRLRGPVNSAVSLTILRGDARQRLAFQLTRHRIFLPTVEMKNHDGILLARVSGFNSRTARTIAEMFRAAERASIAPIRGVVVDLRDNPGGLLREAVSVADLFLRRGRIVSTRGRHPDSIHEFSARTDDLAASLPLVVIVNGKSASSAEIVAAALQDHERAVVIGTTSFGKGTVQTVARLPNDGELTLTWSRFVTPSGYLLHGLGVAPTVCTAGPGDARALVTAALDHIEETARTLAAWRTVALADVPGRERLRAACPASDKSRDVDLDVANILIGEHELYRRAASGAHLIASAAE